MYNYNGDRNDDGENNIGPEEHIINLVREVREVSLRS